MILLWYTVYCIFEKSFFLSQLMKLFSTNVFVLVTASAQKILDINNIQYEVKGNLNMFFWCLHSISYQGTMCFRDNVIIKHITGMICTWLPALVLKLPRPIYFSDLEKCYNNALESIHVCLVCCVKGLLSQNGNSVSHSDLKRLTL